MTEGRKSGERVTVAVIDDDTLIREGLRVLAREMLIVGVFDTAEHFLDAQPAADVVLLDLELGGAGRTQGLQGAPAVTRVSRDYRVLLYTNERRREVLVGCLAAGARGIVHKSEPMSTLEDAVTNVAAGEIVITYAIAGLVELANDRGRIAQLTPRERDVLRHRARGESYSAIGRRLNIAPKTAQEYMAGVSAKFGDYLRAHSPADLETHLGIGHGDLLDT